MDVVGRDREKEGIDIVEEDSMPNPLCCRVVTPATGI